MWIIRINIYPKDKRKHPDALRQSIDEKALDKYSVKINRIGTVKYVDLEMSDDLSETEGYYLAVKLAKKYIVDSDVEIFSTEIEPMDELFKEK